MAGLVKFISAFIPSKKARWRFRNRMAIGELKRSGSNTVEIAKCDAPRVRLAVKGRGNVIRIGALKPGAMLDIRICGDGNIVEIGEGCAVAQSLRILVGQDHANFGPVEKSSVKIGPGTTFESCSMFIYTSNSSIEMGGGCMVSHSVTLYHGDAHPVMDAKTGSIRNRVGKMSVGEHVWLGANSTLLKNAAVADGCIVGFGSVVSGKFTKSGTAIAGNPAKCVTREGDEITWARGNPDYIRNETEGAG